ncbi:unnamed protein product [Clonostachys rosea f. rosea IK726]|uniref:Uncharacterized protein n=1 Tax=Clonostachys rosea f. rosea IK726 TaxID=1349383 RepID=A0ACA9THH5_BIOOC|nr:unnamed protein product [Clonostachys rosea f. rosea IK726]
MFFDKEGNKRLTRRDEICEYPEFLSNIQNYHVAGHKLVLRISPWASGDERDEAGLLFRIKTFTERRLALQALKQSNNSWNLVSLQFHIEIKDYKRKYDTVNWILLGNRPSNPNVFGLIPNYKGSGFGKIIALAIITYGLVRSIGFVFIGALSVVTGTWLVRCILQSLKLFAGDKHFPVTGAFYRLISVLIIDYTQ